MNHAGNVGGDLSRFFSQPSGFIVAKQSRVVEGCLPVVICNLSL
jgi:hypothetical protein